MMFSLSSVSPGKVAALGSFPHPENVMESSATPVQLTAT
jgi:hypothetical protein